MPGDLSERERICMDNEESLLLESCWNLTDHFIAQGDENYSSKFSVVYSNTHTHTHTHTHSKCERLTFGPLFILR